MTEKDNGSIGDGGSTFLEGWTGVIRRHLTAPTLALLLAASSLGGCAYLQGSTAGNDALQGTKLALTTYADVYQPAVITYGHLLPCPAATIICKDEATLANLKSYDAKATAAIVAAQAVLEGNLTDAGQLADAMAKIQAAETAIASSGAMVPVKGQ